MNFSALFGSVLAFGAYFALLVSDLRSAYVGVMSTVVALFVSSIFEAYDCAGQRYSALR